MDEILFRYYISTKLLVCLHIPNTQKWAAECNPPLRFRRHTMMDGIINFNSTIVCMFYLHNVVG